MFCEPCAFRDRISELEAECELGRRSLDTLTRNMLNERAAKEASLRRERDASSRIALLEDVADKARNLLLGGQHEGECGDKPDHARQKHVREQVRRAIEARRVALRSALARLDEETP